MRLRIARISGQCVQCQPARGRRLMHCNMSCSSKGCKARVANCCRVRVRANCCQSIANCRRQRRAMKRQQFSAIKVCAITVSNTWHARGHRLQHLCPPHAAKAEVFCHMLPRPSHTAPALARMQSHMHTKVATSAKPHLAQTHRHTDHKYIGEAMWDTCHIAGDTNAAQPAAVCERKPHVVADCHNSFCQAPPSTTQMLSGTTKRLLLNGPKCNEFSATLHVRVHCAIRSTEDGMHNRWQGVHMAIRLK